MSGPITPDGPPLFDVVLNELAWRSLNVARAPNDGELDTAAATALLAERVRQGSLLVALALSEIALALREAE